MFIEISLQDMEDYIKWAKDKAFCNSGQHICDKLAILFEDELKEFYDEVNKIE